MPPLALKATLTAPGGPLGQLDSLRDDTLNRLSSITKQNATRAQRDFIDALATSRAQVRSIDQSLLSRLSQIQDNSVTSQITAALVLIQMKVSPVISLHIPFGGDNHADAGLKAETAQTLSGIGAIATLLAQLEEQKDAAGLPLSESVTFGSLNVFGRTLGASSVNGRQHNANHEVSLIIGKPFAGGVMGGVGPVDGDFGALTMDSKTGRAAAGGDISPTATLAAFGKTLLAGSGIASDVVADQVAGTVIEAALR